MTSKKRECSPLSLVVQPKQELHGDDDEGSSLHVVQRHSRMWWAATRMKLWIHHPSALNQPAQQRMELSWSRTREENSQHYLCRVDDDESLSCLPGKLASIRYRRLSLAGCSRLWQVIGGKAGSWRNERRVSASLWMAQWDGTLWRTHRTPNVS